MRLTDYQILTGTPAKLNTFAEHLVRTKTPFERVMVRTGRHRQPAIKIRFAVYAALLGHKQRQPMDTINDVIQQDYFIQELHRRRCRTCLRALTCTLVRQAKQAQPDAVIDGLVLERGRIRCRAFQNAATIPVPGHRKKTPARDTSEPLFPNYHY